MQIWFKNVDEMKEFVSIMERFDGEADISFGRYDVDAKSLLGVFSIGLNKPMTLVVYGELPTELSEKIALYEYRAIA